MSYYAKLVPPCSKRKKIYVEIWKSTPIGDSEYDELVSHKLFWTFGRAQKWSNKELLRYNMKDKMKYVFIKDEDILRKEL
jgi:hypothetical protein